MTGVTTGQVSLPTCTDSDDTEVFLTSALVTAEQTLVDKFHNSTGHAHNASGGGAPIGTSGIASGVTLTSPHFTTAVVDSGGLVASTSDITARRFKGTGTAIVAGDIVLSAGWGSTASVAVASGSTDERGTITVTPAGSGIGANPTVTLTYKDGTWTTTPFPIAVRQGGSGTGADLAITSTATTLVIQFLGTPVNGLTQIFTWHVIG